jgi:mannose-6-phosphate isomerase-like protein (cupin superfamily)
MNQSFQAFEADLRAQGFDEVLTREWAPLAVADTHVHPFTAKALVVRGEMWLTVGDSTQHLLPGGTFALDAGVPHSERYGSEGATYWVGRRSGPAGSAG